jgi:hypothetical protein
MGHSGDESERVRENRRFFRRTNELVSRILAEGAAVPGEDFRYFCECGRATCDRRLDLTRGEFMSALRDPTYRIVAPGHEAPDDRVVETRETFSIVISSA